MKAKIYTKTGDQGQTSLLGGKHVSKSHPRLEAYGTLDELNSVIGLLRSTLATEKIERDILSRLETRLQRVQNCLFNIGSHLACDTQEMSAALPNLRASDVQSLELDMDQWENELPELRNFILPGGSTAAGFAHLARTVCRRAERATVLLAENAKVDANHIVYLNRLSDWLFLLARQANAWSGRTDVVWDKG